MPDMLNKYQAKNLRLYDMFKNIDYRVKKQQTNPNVYGAQGDRTVVRVLQSQDATMVTALMTVGSLLI